MSVTVGLLTFLMMPASITETHKILRGNAQWLHGKNGWWTEHEEKVLVNRLLRDDTSKGTMHNRQHVDTRGIWAAIKDIDLWPLYAVSQTLKACERWSDVRTAWASCLYPFPASGQLPVSDTQEPWLHCV